MSERYIEIKGWERFQHRDAARSTVPTWIKVYTELMAKDEFLDLSFHLRGVLVSLWLEYASARRQLSDSTVRLSRRLGQRVTTRDLDSLSRAGFITFSASKPASIPAGIVAGVEKNRRDIPLYPHSVGTENGTRASGQNPRALGTNPRAVAKRGKTDRHDALLERARTDAPTWGYTTTDELHDRLDALEREHGGRFTDQERGEIIDEVLELA